jgi:hypothetical protein
MKLYSNFVIFGTSVVKIAFLSWLRLSRAAACEA